MKKSVDLKKVCELTEQNAVDRDHTKAYNDLLLDNYAFTCQIIAGLPGDTLLDVGVGHGVVAIAASQMGYVVTAIDKMKPFVKPKLYRREKVDFALLDVEKDSLFSKDRQFDVVVMTEVLEHLDFNPLPTIKKLFTKTAPNGHILITTPAKETQGSAPGKFGKLSSWRKIPTTGDWDLDEHTYHYSMVELVAIIEEAGYETVAFGRCYRGASNYILAKR